VKMAQPYEGKNPVVLGRLGHNPAYPTVAFYGHYDVQVHNYAIAGSGSNAVQLSRTHPAQLQSVALCCMPA
jgi:hypothetical protein